MSALYPGNFGLTVGRVHERGHEALALAGEALEALALGSGTR